MNPVKCKSHSSTSKASTTEEQQASTKRLGKGENTVTYGLAEVENAVNLGAVEKLIIADTLLRDADDEQRLRLEKLMHETERRNGTITVISTEHEAGTKLTALGSIAALLRFPTKY